MVEEVCTARNTFMVNFGDNIEAIGPHDKRFQHSTSAYKTSKDQADAVIRLFKPMGDKLLVIGDGNHEVVLNNEFQVGKYIAEQLKVPFGGISFKLEVYDNTTRELAHKMFFHHGAGCITSNAKDDIQAEANMKASLKGKLLRTAQDDCIVMGMGHIHRSLIVDPTASKKLHLCTEHGKIQQYYRIDEAQNVRYIAPDSRYYFSNPSFMRLYGEAGDDYNSYAERFMLSPSEIGFSKIHIEDNKVVGIEFVRL
jgi:hypothetical protein